MTVASGSRSLKVGLMLPQTEGMRGPGIRGWKEVNEMAVLAEEVGFDSLWLVDHLLYRLDGEDRARGGWGKRVPEGFAEQGARKRPVGLW